MDREDDAETTHEKPMHPASHGIPSKKSILFDYFDLPMPLGARWDREHFLELAFPKKLQTAQFDLAMKVLSFVEEHEEVDGESLAKWAHEHNIPNSTLRNLVIPKLVRMGMLSRERRNPSGQKDKDKRHEMVLKLSSRFGEAFTNIGGQWNSLVETARIKRRGKTEKTDF